MTYLSSEEVEQKYIEACGQELGALLHRLVGECSNLHWKWGDYVELFGTTPERIDLLNRAAGGFFSLLQDSLWEDVLLHLARLVDRPTIAGKANLSLHRLPGMVAPDLRPSLEALVENCVASCAFARDWRMRHLAHRDLALALGEEVQPLADASRLAVHQALESVVAVLNAVEQHYMRSEVAFDLGRSRGALELLHVLRDGIDAKDRRMDRLRTGKLEPGDLGPSKSV